MHRYYEIVSWVYVSLQLCVFLLILRRRLYRRVPIFTAYTVFVALSATLLLVIGSEPRLYFYSYWSADTIEILFAMASVYESFAHVFRDFSRVRGFRWLLPIAIIFALAYSGWGTYRLRPANFSLKSSILLVSSIVQLHYVLVCICVLFFWVAAFFHARWRLPEFGVVLGFGIEAAAFGIAAVVRSEFGTRYAFWSQEFPAIGYIAGQIIWLNAVLGRNGSIERTTPVSPKPEMVENLREQARVLRKFLGKR